MRYVLQAVILTSLCFDLSFGGLDGKRADEWGLLSATILGRFSFPVFVARIIVLCFVAHWEHAAFPHAFHVICFANAWFQMAPCV